MKEERPNEIARDLDAAVTHGCDNGPGSPIPQDAQSLANDGSGEEPTVENKAEQPLRVRKAGGPRTPESKQRTKLNALKHGVFSTSALVKGDSKASYESLLDRRVQR